MTNIYPSGHEEANISKKFQLEIGRKIQNFGNDCVVLNPGGVLYPGKLLTCLDILYKFKALPSDVFVVSYPKTGSTWTQEIIWSMLHNPNLNHPRASMGPYQKAPCFEMDVFSTLEHSSARYLMQNPGKENAESFLDLYEALPCPRVFKSHLHFSLMNPKSLTTSRFIYVIRNPLDVCVSYYHFSRNMPFLNYPDDLSTFVEDFLQGRTLSGSYIEHLKQWWKHKENENICTIYFEDMKKDISGQIQKLTRFLGADLTQKQLENVQEFTCFSLMQDREETRRNAGLTNSKNFYRKGKTGSYKEDLSPEQISRIKKHFRDNLGEVRLPYDLAD